MPTFEPHLVHKKPTQTTYLRECKCESKTRKEWVTSRQKI